MRPPFSQDAAVSAQTLWLGGLQRAAEFVVFDDYLRMARRGGGTEVKSPSKSDVIQADAGGSWTWQVRRRKRFQVGSS